MVVVDGVAANVWRPKQQYGRIEARTIDRDVIYYP